MADPAGQAIVKKSFDDISFFDYDGPSDRNEYIRKLENCRFGFHGGSRWAMSSQDGLCKGVPYVFEIGNETGELFGHKMETGFKTTDEAIDLFNAHSPRLVASLISNDEQEHQHFYQRVDAPFIGDNHTRWVDGQRALNKPELGLSNWANGRLFGRHAILTGDSVYTVRTRYIDASTGRSRT